MKGHKEDRYVVNRVLLYMDLSALVPQKTLTLSLAKHDENTFLTLSDIDVTQLQSCF